MDKINLTVQDMFQLGFAYGSFSVNEIDQGIHIVLPGTDVNTKQDVNMIFKLLFTKYFDKIPPDLKTIDTGFDYMNTIQDFLKNDTTIDHESFYFTKIRISTNKDKEQNGKNSTNNLSKTLST